MVVAATLGVAVLPASDAQALTVYAASSLREALPALDRGPAYGFAASNTLRLQIERGAPADVFVSADTAQPQALFRARRCARPVTVATNRLALLVPRANRAGIRSVFSLRAGGFRLAVGAAGVPIGDYTRALLRRMKLEAILRVNTVSSEPSVAGITSKVALGSADAGFAYVTDAKAAGRRVRAIALPGWAQPPVRYQACAVRRDGADASGAAAYLRRLASSRGRAVLARFGFGLPPRA
jgi:molybdate transport system substrate-binding protein